MKPLVGGTLGWVTVVLSVVVCTVAPAGPMMAAAWAEPVIGSITLSEQDRDLTVGQTATGTVTLSEPAPTGGAVVSLQSSQPTAVTVPATLMIPQGSRSGTFTITASAPTTTTAAAITASLGGSQAFEALVVRPAPVAPAITMALERNTLLVGGTMRATLTLATPAPAGGMVYNFGVGVNNPTWVAYNNDAPGAHSWVTVTFPQGQTTQTVTFRMIGPFPNLPTTVSVSAWAPCAPTPCSSPVGARDAIQVLASAAISAVTLSSATVYGGATVTGTVTTTDPVSTDTPVQIQVAFQDNVQGGGAPGSDGLSVPAPIAVIRTGSNSATFSFQAPPVRRDSYWATIARFVGAPVNSGKTATITVKPLTVSDFRFNPVTVTGNRNSVFAVTGTVTLSAPAPAGGAAITTFPLTSGYGLSAGRLEYTNTVIPQGQTSGTVTVTVGNIMSNIDLQFKAIYAATNSERTQTLTVRYAENPPPDNRAAWSGEKAQVPLPAGSQLALKQLDARAGPGGETGQMVGEKGQMVGEKGQMVGEKGQMVGERAQMARPAGTQLTLKQAVVVLSSLTVAPGSVHAGHKVSLTATLSDNAAGPVVLQLTGVNGTITIPAGQSTASITLTAPAVAKPMRVRIAAEYGGISKVADLAILP